MVTTKSSASCRNTVETSWHCSNSVGQQVTSGVCVCVCEREGCCVCLNACVPVCGCLGEGLVP
jgi:hypothetical protein